jgi:hypothetical protein
MLVRIICSVKKKESEQKKFVPTGAFNKSGKNPENVLDFSTLKTGVSVEAKWTCMIRKWGSRYSR